MNEVCSTTLPQAVLPKILSDDRYEPHLDKRRHMYEKRAKFAAAAFGQTSDLEVVEPKGAFYLTVTFSDGFINKKRSRQHIKDPNISKLLNLELAKDKNCSLDKKFCLEMLASTGICVVPLSSGFNTKVEGFRMTVLESDDKKFATTVDRIIEFAGNY